MLDQSKESIPITEVTGTATLPGRPYFNPFIHFEERQFNLIKSTMQPGEICWNGLQVSQLQRFNRRQFARQTAS